MSEKKDGTVTVADLLEVSKETYRLLDNPDSPSNVLPGFEYLGYSFDKVSHHGGVAFYHEDSATVVLGHRGSATAKDWLVTDVKIALGAEQTKADIAAIDFAEGVLADLNRRKKAVSQVIETGHSKGGRESQMVIAHLTQKGEVPCVGITFNSARISPEIKFAGLQYDHVNLRMRGTNVFKVDPVSSYGKHLGQNVDFPNPEVRNFVHAHKIGTFDSGLAHMSEIGGMEVRKFVDSCQQGLTVTAINEAQKSQNRQDKTALEMIRDHHAEAEVVNLRSTKGKIVAETDRESIQRLGDGSRYFKIHVKSELSVVPKVGENVQINYSANRQKAEVKSIGQKQSRGIK